MIGAAFDDLMHARAHGLAEIIYLKCDVATLRNRLRRDGGDRPALRGSNAIDEVEQVVREREPVYTRLASVVIDAAPDSSSVVDPILKWLAARDAAAR
jgi:shikimate kinase